MKTQLILHSNCAGSKQISQIAGSNAAGEVPASPQGDATQETAPEKKRKEWKERDWKAGDIIKYKNRLGTALADKPKIQENSSEARIFDGLFEFAFEDNDYKNKGKRIQEAEKKKIWNRKKDSVRRDTKVNDQK